MPSDTDTLVSVVGIDPGSETMGVGIITYDAFTHVIASCEAYTFTGSKLPGSEWLGSIAPPRVQRIAAHETNLVRIFRRVRPLAVASEAPFINKRFPQAGLVLTEVISAIRQAVKTYDPWRVLYMIEPSRAKNAVGASGGADKDAVKAALLQLPELVNTALTPLAELDEHSVDALAVAYCQVKCMWDSNFSPLN